MTHHSDELHDEYEREEEDEDEVDGLELQIGHLDADFVELGQEGDVGLSIEGPLHVQVVLLHLEEEHDEDEERVQHQDAEDDVVAQVEQLTGNL